jgi:hypothetical protein
VSVIKKKRSESKMNTLENLKQMLGDDYSFHATLSLEKVREVLKENDVNFTDEVVFVLNAGHVNIEATIFVSSLSKDGSIIMSIGYDCCIKDRELRGDWISYDSIPDDINLNVEDMEAEMFRVLDKFVFEHGLSYFNYNGSEIQNKKDVMINE